MVHEVFLLDLGLLLLLDLDLLLGLGVHNRGRGLLIIITVSRCLVDLALLGGSASWGGLVVVRDDAVGLHQALVAFGSGEVNHVSFGDQI